MSSNRPRAKEVGNSEAIRRGIVSLEPHHVRHFYLFALIGVRKVARMRTHKHGEGLTKLPLSVCNPIMSFIRAQIT